jgi:diguanylate cyclase (GGDEF)-like protein
VNKGRLLALGYLVSVAVLVLSALSYFTRHLEVVKLQDAIRYTHYEPVWHNTALYLDYHRFLDTTARFVYLDSELTIADVQKRFDVFYSRIDVLDVNFASNIDSANQLSGAPLAMTEKIRNSIEQIQQLVDRLDEVEAAIPDLARGDHEGYLAIYSALADLQLHAVPLLLQSFNLYRAMMFKQQQLENWSADQRLLVFCGLLLGSVVFLLLLSYHLRHRRKSAVQLASANRNLTRKIRETDELNRRLHHQASRDELTGLWNRRGLARLLAGVNSPGGGQSLECGLCFIDLDEFKVVNDTCGHAAGDDLLVRVASLLQSAVPDAQVLCRFGGDEFVIAWREINGEQFLRQLRLLCNHFDRLQFVFEERKFDIGASIGALQFRPGQYSQEQLITLADTACYIAKERGGRRFHLHSDTDGSVYSHQRQMGWLAEMNNAFDEQRFLLFAQPIVPLQRGRGEGDSWEILIRMTTRDGQIVAPGEFLSAAERYAMISRIDRWVIAQTFGWIRRNPQRMASLAGLHINLSGVTIGQSDIVDYIRHCAESEQIDPSRVCLEVTETAASGREAAVTLRELADLGFCIALDDFGSGFSSFRYLRELPVDVLKIDGLFVRDIAHDDVQREFVRSINDLAHVLGKRTVAEYVENQAALDILGELGVDYGQGYFVGQPLPLETSASVAQTTPEPREQATPYAL